MDCERAIRENTIERYLAGTLDAQAREEWELHYFGCDVCADRLENLRAIREALEEMAPQIRNEIRREMRPQRTASRWWWIAVPVAIALLFLLTLVPDPRRQSTAGTKKPDFTLLARLDPPAYNAPVLRGVESPAEQKFREAMTAYQAKDWPRAIEGLEASLALDRSAAAPMFFHAASEFLAGNVDEGVDEMEVVAAGSSPFAEEARFDLAKGYLAQDRKDDALAALRQCQGDFATQAADLIARIEAAK